MKDLIKVARKLRSLGLVKEASILDSVIKNASMKHNSILTLDQLISALTDLRNTAPGNTPVYGPYSEAQSGLTPILKAELKEEQDDGEIDFNTFDWENDQIPMMSIIALS